MKLCPGWASTDAATDFRCSGVTLIELLVALALTGVIALAWVSFYLTGYRGFDNSDNQTEVQDQARVAADYLYRSLIQAQKVVKLTDDEVVFLDSTGQKLGFRYYNGVLYRDFYQTVTSTIPAASNPVANLVEELRFTSPQSGVIKVFMVTASHGYSYRLQTSMTPRCRTGVFSE
ncbi:MAG: prepilin-type N-terminal cleavage/methylation domain-containing protein [Syntrophothermus sp.]|uniref:PilW family protein n=1 Tax=Syntrophothermus sp. TaxID=2736299 RepID=UPI00257D7236|nr:prepilin-type N-terminal cleavage/methylation domain-containing protein [Syntrophothermus sp.]NSW81712.1 prepilin-type N-terminal cleavage/methylation domain-containing protein [Syntrophothermus sp.]